MRAVRGLYDNFRNIQPIRIKRANWLAYQTAIKQYGCRRLITDMGYKSRGSSFPTEGSSTRVSSRAAWLIKSSFRFVLLSRSGRADRRGRRTASFVESDRRGAWAECSREHVTRIRVPPWRQLVSLLVKLAAPAIRIRKELLSGARLSTTAGRRRRWRRHSLGRMRDVGTDNEIQTNVRIAL